MYIRDALDLRQVFLGVHFFLICFVERDLPESAARLSVEAVGRLVLPRLRKDDVWLSTDPCWLQQFSSTLLPLFLLLTL